MDLGRAKASSESGPATGAQLEMYDAHTLSRRAQEADRLCATLIAGRRFLDQVKKRLGGDMKMEAFKQMMISSAIFGVQIGLACAGIPGLGSLPFQGVGKIGTVAAAESGKLVFNVGVSVTQKAVLTEDPSLPFAATHLTEAQRRAIALGETDLLGLMLMGSSVRKSLKQAIKDSASEFVINLQSYPFETCWELVLGVTGLTELRKLLQSAHTLIDGDTTKYNTAKAMLIRMVRPLLARMSDIAARIAQLMTVEPAIKTLVVKWKGRITFYESEGTASEILAKYHTRVAELASAIRTWGDDNFLLLLDLNKNARLPPIETYSEIAGKSRAAKAQMAQRARTGGEGPPPLPRFGGHLKHMPKKF